MMSYCRWSCENGYSDVYVYEGVNGFVTHVAGRRFPPGAPQCDLSMALKCEGGSVSKYMKAILARDKWLSENPATDIDHPEAGKSFKHDTAIECAENLERLRGEGFVVPQYAIDALREDHEAERKDND